MYTYRSSLLYGTRTKVLYSALVYLILTVLACYYCRGPVVLRPPPPVANDLFVDAVQQQRFACGPPGIFSGLPVGFCLPKLAVQWVVGI